MATTKTTTDAKARRVIYLQKLLGSLPKAPKPTLLRPASDRRIR